MLEREIVKNGVVNHYSQPDCKKKRNRIKR